MNYDRSIIRRNMDGIICWIIYRICAYSILNCFCNLFSHGFMTCLNFHDYM